MTAAAPVVTDWTAEGTRPAGQPGEVRRAHGESWSYPAVRTADGRVLYWMDLGGRRGSWLLAPPLLADSFQPGEEWQADCDHNHTGRSFFDATPWRTCDTEADCVSLRREQATRWGR